MKKNLFILLLLILELPACKKQDTASPLDTNTNLLTAGNWRLTASVYQSITGTTEEYSTLPACRKDDYRHFNKDGSGEINEGPTTCNISDPQSRNMSWKFLNNSANKIEIDFYQWVIEQLDNNTFKIHTLTTDPYASVRTITYGR